MKSHIKKIVISLIMLFAGCFYFISRLLPKWVFWTVVMLTFWFGTLKINHFLVFRGYGYLPRRVIESEISSVTAQRFKNYLNILVNLLDRLDP